jgi:energy-coupling factor transporter ATP-binding protein EcfA2
VKGLLVEEILSASPPSIALHTACMALRGGALLLSGAPGAGKSTLATALSHAGVGYAGDDITLLHPDGLVQGVPFAASVKRGAWPLLRRSFPQLTALPTHVRLDGLPVRYLPVPTARSHAGWLKVDRIVHLRRTPDARAQLLEREPAVALTWLMGEAHSSSGPAKLEDLRVFIGVVQQARRHELIYSDLDDAVRTLIAACADS